MGKPKYEVKNITRSKNACKKNGGKIIIKTQKYGNAGKYCVIQDPAGAVCALFEMKEKK